MTTGEALIIFSMAAGLLTITPGLDTALVVRTSAVEGRARAMAAGVGICLGCFMWGLAASAGLGALLSKSRAAYSILRVIGACYLVFLGIKMFRAAGAYPFAETSGGPLASEPDPLSDQSYRWFIRGFCTNILNPKVGIFYVTFLPQFVPAGANVLSFSMLLTAIHACEGFVWFYILTAATNLFSKWLHRPRVVKALDRATGSVLVGFGVGLIPLCQDQ